MRLVVARCTVHYIGRLEASLPEAVRLIMVKADGCVAIHADGGAYKPLNSMNGPNEVKDFPDRWEITNPEGEKLTVMLHEVLSDSSHDLGDDPGLSKDGVEAHLQELRAADPTVIEELVKDVQRIVKAMLAYGARMPKELMLYLKNIVFPDGAIARLAPDLDLLGEIAQISMLFAQRHGERLGRELGIDHTQVEINLDSVKAGLGVSNNTDCMTYRHLQKRRELIQKRMRDHVGR